MGVSALVPRTKGPASLHGDGDEAVSTPGDVGPARIWNGLSPPRSDCPSGVSVSMLPALMPLRRLKGFSPLCRTDLEPEPEPGRWSVGVPAADKSLPEERDINGLAPPRTDLSIGVPSPWAGEALLVLVGEVEEDDVVRSGRPEELA